MKHTINVTILVVIFLTLHASIFAQQPGLREQFQTAVAACQKTAIGENAIAVIKLYRQLDPPPTVPEEAREPFVMGATILKKASNPVEAGKAVDLFTQSLNVAPWYAEAYYNRALARETAGQFTEAMADLKLYLEFKLTETERREAQDKIYALKADAQLAIAKKAKEQNAADAAESKKKADNAAVLARTKKSIEGAWFSNVPGFSTPSFVVTRSGNDFKVEMPGGKNAFGDQLVARNIEAAETSLRFTYEVYVGTPVTYDLKREGDDLLVGQTIVNKTTKLSTERLTRKPWTGAP